jgi:hypothetical protein
MFINVRRKIVGVPHQSATVAHRYLFVASVNRGSFCYMSALHWIMMVGGILDAFTIFRLSLNHCTESDRFYWEDIFYRTSK